MRSCASRTIAMGRDAHSGKGKNERPAATEARPGVQGHNTLEGLGCTPHPTLSVAGRQSLTYP
jgi:hypothetical protein